MPPNPKPQTPNPFTNLNINLEFK